MKESESIKKIKIHLSKQFSLDDEQIETMLPTFITTLSSHMQNLESALMSADPERIGKAGHTIKGAFLNLGMEKCAHIALAIEENSKSGTFVADNRKLVADLGVRIGAVIN